MSKKPDYEKWVKKESWSSWEAVCIFCDIEPPDNIDAYFRMRSKSKKIQQKENECYVKGLFKEMNCPHPNDYM